MGPNVDVIGGPVVKQHPWQGDPGGQRQNEASCFVDSRNPLVMGCAFNDYTPVEIESDTGETGDAWIGQSVSTDGGATWRKFLFPGYPQHCAAGGTSSLCGHDAGADPTWRGGPNGRSYLSGIVFNRGDLSGGSGAQSNGVVFVQPYVNNNNVQNDPNPLKPDPAINGGQPVIIDTGNSGQFQDKTWLAVGPDGKVYVTYATFVGGNQPHSTIYVQVSADGGKTFTRSKLSEGEKVSNGTIITNHADKPCWVDVSWRRRKTPLSPTETDAIQFVRSTDCGKSWTSPTTIASLTELVRGDGSKIGRLFDQGTGQYFFRNISNPAMAPGPNGTTYVAWAERIQSPDPVFGAMVTRDSHIKLTVGMPAKSNGNQVNWMPPVTVDSLTPGTPPLRGHQLRPSMWFASGKLYLSAAFLQEDQTAGVYTRQEICDPGKTGCDPNNPSLTPDKTITTYVESRAPKGELLPSPPSATQVGRAFTESIIDLAPKFPTLDVSQPSYEQNLKRRHTEEIGVWQGTPGNGYPSFTFAKVTRFPMRARGNGSRVFDAVGGNSWTMSLHCKGKCAFAGDYDDIVSQAFVSNGSGGYIPNVDATTQTPAYVAWTDNRFVRPITLMENYHPASDDPNGSCSGVDDTGTRNQEVLISRIGNGVYAYVMGNQKLITTAVPRRAFTVAIQNGVNATKHYRVSASQPTGINAYWKQFDITKTTIDISLPPFTTGARQLYVKGGNSPVRVDVVEISAPGGGLVTGGLQTFTMVNPDPSTPGLLPPTPDGSIDPTNPNSNEIYTPDVTAPDVTAPDVTANVVVTPDVTAPDVTAPDVTAPDVTAVGAQIPDVTAPDVTAPDVTAPDVTAPDVTAPDVTAIPPGAELTDTLVKVKNNSNVATGISVKTLLTKPLPDGFKLQVLVTKTYYTVTQKNCVRKPQVASALVANIPNPNVVTDTNGLTFDPTDPSAKELTVAIPPGGDVIVDYRLLIPADAQITKTTDAFGREHAFSPAFNPAIDIVPVGIPESVSTNVPFDPNCGTGEGQPPCPTPTPVAPLSILTTSLYDAVVGVPYPPSSQNLKAYGGKAPYTWSVAPNTLPAGLTLTPAGVISGTPTSAGIVTFTVTVTDANNFQKSRSLTIRVADPLVITAASLPHGRQSAAYNHTAQATGGLGAYTWSSANLPAGLSLNSSTGAVSGTPTAPGFATITVTDSANPQNTASRGVKIKDQFAAFGAGQSQTFLETDYASAGVGGMRGFGDGTLSISGIPAGATITRALLYWNGPTNDDNTAANAAVLCNGTLITGQHIGTASSNCWPYDRSYSYVADVSGQVTGNGSYALANFTKTSPDISEINGVSLVVLYEDADLANDRDLYLFQGNDSDRVYPDEGPVIEAANWNVVISGVNYGGTGAATLELHVSDGSDGAIFGDSSDDGPVKLNNVLIAGEGTAVTFDGDSVPNRADFTFPGWDRRIITITSIVAASSTLTLTSEENVGGVNDCLSVVVAIVSVPHAPPPPPGPFIGLF